KWEVVLDIDLLSQQEGKTWVWHGVQFLSSNIYISILKNRCLISLSRGGADADETREFDLTSKTWVLPSKLGFYRPEGKGGLSWKDADTVYVYTDFGPNTLTDSGYPRIVKEWKRGQDLKDATIIYEGLQTDMYISALISSKTQRSFVSRTIAFYNDELYLINDDNSLTHLKVLPNSSKKEVHNDYLFLELRSNWKNFEAGSLIVTDLTNFLKDQENGKWEILFSPVENPNVFLSSFCFTKNYVIMNQLDNVKSKIVIASLTDNSLQDNKWLKRQLTKTDISNIVVSPIDPDNDDRFFITMTDYLNPSVLFLADLSTLKKAMFPATILNKENKIIKNNGIKKRRS
ncbi:MAG: S9 family peptidase, partial [Candidatus Paceibacterota bacterium]